MIPLVGLGTYKLTGNLCETTVHRALELGYRHIDTADVYQNHQAIGRAIKSWPREQLFLTTKLSFHELAPAQVQEGVHRFLKELDVEYLDLLLIHWPNPDIDMTQTLKTMLDFKEKGSCRHIGVSNFVRRHLEAIASDQFPIFINQIELHPYFQRTSLLEACKTRKIQVTAYRPLAKGAFETDPILQKIGKKYGKTASQIALKWAVQQNISVIPKASTLQHLKDNLEIFDFSLSDIDIQEINRLDAGKRFCAPNGLPLYED